MLTHECVEQMWINANSARGAPAILDSVVSQLKQENRDYLYLISRSRLQRSTLHGPIADWLLLDTNSTPVLQLHSGNLIVISFSSDENQLRSISAVGMKTTEGKVAIDLFPQRTSVAGCVPIWVPSSREELSARNRLDNYIGRYGEPTIVRQIVTAAVELL